MDLFEEKANRQFQLMVEPARERLKKYSVQELCGKGKLGFDENRSSFIMESIGEEIRIHYPDFVIEQELEMWHHLTILQYMDTADGAPLTGEKISLSQMRGGLSRGRGYEKHIETMFLKDLNDVTKEQFREACERLGGKILDAKADVSAEIYYAPCFPVTVNFWEADEEYPLSVKVLLDGSAEHYLTIEAAGGACLTVLEKIHEICVTEKK